MQTKLPVILLILFLALPCLAQPRIDSIAVDEDKGELVLHGSFPNSISAIVLVDSVSLPVVLTRDTLLRAMIPVSGKGSAGFIKVNVNGQISNQKILTYLHLLIFCGLHHLYSDGGSELVLNWDSIHIRTDVTMMTMRYLSSSKQSRYRALAQGNNGIHGYIYKGPTYDSSGILHDSLLFDGNKLLYYTFSVPETSMGGGAQEVEVNLDQNYQIISGNRDYFCENSGGGSCLEWSALSATDFSPSSASVGKSVQNTNVLYSYISSNPINTNTDLITILKSPTKVLIQILDILGHIVSSDEKMLQAGENKLPINSSALPSGIYICRLQAGGEVVSVRFVKE